MHADATHTMFAAINRTDRMGSPIWTAEATPEEALAKAEQVGLDPETLIAVPVGPGLADAIESGRYAPETRWELTDDGVAELPDDGSVQVVISDLRPVWLTETEQVWHVGGLINAVAFTACVDDVGHAIGDSLDCWLKTKHECSRDVVDAVLAEIEREIILTGASDECD